MIPGHTVPLPLPAPLAVSRGAWLAASDRPRDRPIGEAPGRIARGGQLAGKRVLLVEDEGMVALELLFALEDEGAEVLGPAQSLLKALELVAHEARIDLAVLDVDLSGENVYPVAELLLQRRVPFVFHTGHGSRAELSALFPGTVTFIKPAVPETLIEHLLRIMQ